MPFPCVSHATSLTSRLLISLWRRVPPLFRDTCCYKEQRGEHGTPWGIQPFPSRSQATVLAVGLAQARSPSQYKDPSREQRTRRRKTTSGAWRGCPCPHPPAPHSGATGSGPGSQPRREGTPSFLPHSSQLGFLVPWALSSQRLPAPAELRRAAGGQAAAGLGASQCRAGRGGWTALGQSLREEGRAFF